MGREKGARVEGIGVCVASSDRQARELEEGENRQERGAPPSTFRSSRPELITSARPSLFVVDYL